MIPKIYRKPTASAQTELFDGGRHFTVKEHDIQRQILDYLRAKGIFSVRYNTGMAIALYKGKKRVIRYHNLGPGCADIMALLPGSTPEDKRILWIECKNDRGRQSMAQLGFENAVKAQHMLYVIARSIDDLAAYL